MENLMNNPALGMILSVAAYQLGLIIKRKTQSSLVNPLLIAMLMIIMLINFTPLNYEHYASGGQFIHFMLGPLTVTLGLMIYRQRQSIKKHFLSLTLGITSGILVSFASIVLLSKLFKLPEEFMLSAIPKSITMPMALALNDMLGGIESITVMMVIIAGTGGAFLVPIVLSIMPPLNPVARGIGIGTASHAVGTARALELGHEEGAMSSAAIGMTGLLTVLIAPLLYQIFLT